MRCALLAALLAAAFGARASAAEVDVEVRSVRVAAGHVRVAICKQEEFLKPTCTWKQSVPAEQGTTIVHFTDIPPGTYAAQGYLDEQDWGELRQDIFGFPKEGVGFSNDAPIHYGPPRWEDARFTVDEAPVHVMMTLKYYTL